MPNKLAVVSIWAEDVPTTAHFYRDVIGLYLFKHHGGTLHFDLNEVYLTILKGRLVPAENGLPVRFPLMAFAVDDLEAAIARLQAHGVELSWGIEKDEVSS
jgi:predicted enzyme related to lactoylglutathione lyase